MNRSNGQKEQEGVSTVEELKPVPVVLGGARGGPEVRTLRPKGWGTEKWVTFSILTAFVVYTTWAALQGADFYVGAAQHRDLISPFYSPCITQTCVSGGGGGLGWSARPRRRRRPVERRRSRSRRWAGW